MQLIWIELGNETGGDTMEIDHREITVASLDGLKHGARDWGPENSARKPIVCLPGLTRNARDFNDLAAYLDLQEILVSLFPIPVNP